MLQEMMSRKILRWCFVVMLLSVCGLGACGAYVRMGTTVIGDFVSPDGRWDAVLMVRNDGLLYGNLSRENQLVCASACLVRIAPACTRVCGGRQQWGSRLGQAGSNRREDTAVSYTHLTLPTKRIV